MQHVHLHLNDSHVVSKVSFEHCFGVAILCHFQNYHRVDRFSCLDYTFPLAVLTVSVGNDIADFRRQFTTSFLLPPPLLVMPDVPQVTLVLKI